MHGPTQRSVVFFFLLLLVMLFAASFLAGRLGMGGESRFTLSPEKIAVIRVSGVLNDATVFLREFHRFRDRRDVKAIVVRIESPGGSIVPAQEIFEEIRKLRGSKPVVASLGNVAASGGYYVACAAEEIVANPGSITGSIGVLAVFQNYQELMNKIGLKTEVMKSGEFKDLGNPMRDMTPAEREMEQQLLDSIHQQFVRDVALGRNRSVEEILPLADGRVFTGERALEVGLVDRLGNLQDSIERAAELGGVKGKPTVIYPPERRPSLLEFLFQQIVHRLWGEFAGFRWSSCPALLFAPLLP